MKNKISTIIFDLGGVILNLDYQETINEFLKYINFEKEIFYGSKEQLDFFSDYEIGKISTNELKIKFRNYFKTNLSSENFDYSWNAMLFDFPPKRIQLLKQLGKKYRIFLLSNINEMHLIKVHQIYNLLNEPNSFESLFEKVYYSHIIGLRKPSKQIFQLIITENHLNPSETLFIDDSLQHIEGGTQAGFQGYHLVKPNDIIHVIPQILGFSYET